MQEQQRRAFTVDGSAPDSSPRYLIYFGIPPVITAFAVASLDPMAGLALLACLTVMVIVLKLLFRFAAQHELQSGDRQPTSDKRRVER
jgi:hypothetical protein